MVIRRRARREAEFIERYWSGVRADRATPPPAQLDPDLAAFIARLDDAVQLPEPSAAFVGDLRARLAGQGQTATDARARTVPARPADASAVSRNGTHEPPDAPVSAPLHPPTPLTRRRWASEALKIAAAIVIFSVIGGLLILTVRDTRQQPAVGPGGLTPAPAVSPSPAPAPTSTPAATQTTAAVAPTATLTPPRPTPTLPVAGTLTTITAGSQPRQIATGAGSAWVTNSGEGTVSRIDLTTNQVIATVDLKTEGSAAGYVVDGIAFGDGSVWVSSFVGEQPVIARIDPATNQVVARIPIDETAWFLIYAVDSVWAKGLEPGLVMRIDPRTNSQVASVPLSGVSTLFGSDSVIFATVAGSNDIAVIDPATNTVSSRTLDVTDAYIDYAVVVEGDALWIATATDVRGIDIATGQSIATVPLPEGVRGQGAVLLGLSAAAFWVDRGSPDTLWTLDRATGRALASIALPNWKTLWYADGTFWMPTFDGVVVRLDSST